MRVFITPFPKDQCNPVGGIEVHGYSFEKLLSEKECEVISYHFSQESNSVRENFINNKTHHSFSIQKNILGLVFLIQNIFKILVKKKYSKILVQGIPYLVFPCLLHSTKKTYVIVHGIMRNEYFPEKNNLDLFAWLKWSLVSLFELFNYMLIKNVISISEYIDVLFKSKNLFKFRNFISKERSELIEASIINVKKKNKIIFIGSIIQRKNPLLAVEIFNSLGLDDWELIIIGNPTDKQLAVELEKKIAQSPKKNIKYLGRAAEKTLISELASSKIFLMTSYAETSPISILEAKSSGCKIIAPDQGGIKSLLGGNDLLLKTFSDIATIQNFICKNSGEDHIIFDEYFFKNQKEKINYLLESIDKA